MRLEHRLGMTAEARIRLIVDVREVTELCRRALGCAFVVAADADFRAAGDDRMVRQILAEDNTVQCEEANPLSLTIRLQFIYFHDCSLLTRSNARKRSL